MREPKYWIVTGQGKFDWRISHYFNSREEAQAALDQLLGLPWIKYMDECCIEFTGQYIGIFDEWPEDR